MSTGTFNFTITETLTSKGVLEYYGTVLYGSSKVATQSVFDLSFPYTMVSSVACNPGCYTFLYNSKKSTTYNLV